MFYKVVINKDGTVASCDRVSESFENGKEVFFVDAGSPAQAIMQAKDLWLERYDRELQYKRKSYTDLSSKRREAGLCICGRSRVNGFVQCRACIDKATRKRDRKKAGLDKPKGLLTDEAKILATQKKARDREEWVKNNPQPTLRKIQRILDKFRELTPAGEATRFEGWLIAELARVTEKSNAIKVAQSGRKRAA